MKQYPNIKVRLEGNTDERGSRVYNVGLGERRASAILDVLRADGVFQGQMSMVSYGAEQPVALGHTEEDYRLNRRVDIILPQA